MSVSFRIARAVVLLTAMFLVLPVGLLAYSFFAVLHGFDGTYDRTTPVECGIVFGAAVHSVSEPGPAILRRVEAGAQLYKQGLIQRFILTGGKGSEGQLSEAEVMQQVALKSEIPSDRIRIEPFSSSTWNNVRNILPLLAQCSSSVAISDRYHLARIRLIGYEQGVDFQTFPADAPPIGKFELESIVRETIGYAFYLVVR